MIAEDVDVSLRVTCKNCSQEFVGAYCNACGQKQSERISFRHLWEQLVESLFDVEKGLVYTVRQLTVHPGHTVVAYLNGKRKSIYGPVKYLLLWTAIFFVLSSVIGRVDKQVSITALLFNDHQAFSSESFDDFVDIYSFALAHYTHIFYAGLAPFLAMFCYLLFRKHGFSFIELTIPYLYLSGHLALFMVINTVVMALFGPRALPAIMLTSIIFLLYMLFKMHKEIFGQSWFKTIVKSLAIIYAGQFIYMGLAFLLLNIMRL